MPTAEFHSDVEDDEKPWDYSKGFGNPGDEPIVTPSGTPGPGGIEWPKNVTYEEAVAMIKSQPEFKKLPKFMRDGFFDDPKVKGQILAGINQHNSSNVTSLIPDVVDETTIDPFTDIKHYETGTPLDLSSARDALYDPSTGQTASNFAALEFVHPELTGRDAQVQSLDYLNDLIVGGGHDAVSDAYYEQQRADAEQAARAQREAGQQNLAERGMASGGAGIMNELYASSDVARNAHNAALGAAAMAQQRRDSANSERARSGHALLGQDIDIAQDENKFNEDVASGKDSFAKWYEGMLSDYGKSKSDLWQNESVSNFNRTNGAHDAEVGNFNNVIFHNAQNPWTGFNAFQGATRDESGSNKDAADEGYRGAAYEEAHSPFATAGEILDTGAKVVSLANGIPSGSGSDDDEDE